MSNGRRFQTVGPVKEKDLSPKVCLCVVGSWSVKLRWAKLTRGCVFMQCFWQIPGTTFRKGAMTQKWDLVSNPTWYWKPIKGIENRSDTMLPTTSSWQAWQQHSAPSGVYQWDSWVLLRARSYNSQVLRKQKQKSALWSHHRKGADERRQCDAVLRGQMRRHWWHAGAQ